MKKVNIILLISIMLIFTSCDLNPTPEKTLFKKYQTAYNKVIKSNSYTKDENIKINLAIPDHSKDFSFNMIVKAQGDNWEIGLKTKDDSNIATGYYNDGSLYVDTQYTKTMFNLPKLLAKPEYITFLKEYKVKDIVRASSENNNDIEVITFEIKGKDFFNKFKTLSDYGIKEFKFKDVSASNIIVRAYIDANGYLISQEIVFETVVSVEYENKTYDGVLNYYGKVDYSSINNTTVTKPSGEGYMEITFDKAKSLLSDLFSQIEKIK